jgi:glycosyltransferase involved in cell wall biosynthesis
MNKEKQKIAIGILAYNVDNYIEKVIDELVNLKLKIFVINDASIDSTGKKLKELENIYPITVLENEKNLGAGESLKKLISYLFDKNYEFLIKVDGDGQFLVQDVQKILQIYNENDYEYIKSNRFWKDGIIGKIPKKRFFGNLFATLVMQFTLGTNKLYDPLNGLFGVSLKIHNFIDAKTYPKRYGYPFYITLSCVINNFKTYQINNTVIYSEQKSNLNPIRVLLTIIRLCSNFYIQKIRAKKMIGKFQRSAFLDKLFLLSLLLTLISFSTLTWSIFFERFFLFTKLTNLTITSFLFLFTGIIFVLAFKEENGLRKNQIFNEE